MNMDGMAVINDHLVFSKVRSWTINLVKLYGLRLPYYLLLSKLPVLGRRVAIRLDYI